MLETLKSGYETFSLYMKIFAHEIWKHSINGDVRNFQPRHEKLWTMNIVTFNRDVGNFEQRIWNIQSEHGKLRTWDMKTIY